MRVLLVSLALLAIAASPAEARRHRSVALHPECNITMPCEDAYASPRGVRVARQMPFGAPVLRYDLDPPRAPTRRSRRHHSTSREPRPAPVRQAARPSVSLDGVVPELAAKVREIVSTCGSTIWSTVRHTRIAGTRIMSLHASGQAVDIHGNPSCIYALLHGWPGGYSTDYGRVNHVHVSYGGREHGARFAHGGGRRYARRTRVAHR